MANLAIKGHLKRGKEVIEILEMLGGNNTTYDLDGSDENAYYYIHHDYIDADHKDMIGEPHPEFKHYTLEEFLEKFPYKVGGKVITDDGDKADIVGMVWDNDINDVFYEIQICNEVFKYPKELLQPYKEETMEEKENSVVVNIEDKQLKVNSLRFDKTQLVINDEYELKQEIDAYCIVRKKPQYPKTYEECCDVLKIGYPYFKTKEDGISASTYKNKLFGSLTQLIICRDAYWKIAGEQMGLGKPWEPKFDNNEKIWYILNVSGNIYECEGIEIENKILSFPTAEMRDAFYENFKDLIEQCKELL